MNVLKEKGNNMKIKIYHADELIGEVITNHSMTDEEALRLLGAEPYEMVQMDDPQFIMPNGAQIWWDDISTKYY